MNKSERNRKIGLYTFFQVIGLLALLIIGSCFDWMNFRFSFEQITTWDYWNNVIQQAFMYSVALGLGFSTILEKSELSDEEYLKALEEYRKYLAFKKESFVAYIENVLNPKIKKEAIKAKITKKLYRLDKLAKDEWKICYKECKDMTEDEFSDYSPRVKAKFINFFGRLFRGFKYKEKERFSLRAKHYCYKRRKYEYLASKEYIEENWKYTSIKYQRINPNSFTWSVRIGTEDNSKYKVENHTAKDVASKMVTKILTVTLCSIFLGSILFDASTSELLEQVNGWIAVLIKYIIRVLMIFINFGFGIKDGKNSFYNNFILVINNRSEILKSYIPWAETQEPDGFDNVLDAYLKDKIEETNKKLKEEKDREIAVLEKKFEQLKQKTN